MRTDRGADGVRRLRIAGRALWWVGLFCLVPPLIAAWADVRSVMRAFAALPTRVAPGSPAAAWRFTGVLFFGAFSLLLSGLLRLELYREGGADGTNAPAAEGKGETGTREKTLRRKTESVGCSLVIIAGVLCCVLLSLFAPDGYLFNTPPVFLGAFVFDSAYVYVALYALAAASCVRLFVLRKGGGGMRRSFGAKCVSWMLGAGFLCSSASASIVYSVYVHECGRVPARGEDVHCSLYYSSTTDALASRNGRLYLITGAIGIGEDTGLSWSAEAGDADPLSGMWEVRWESGVGRLLLHTPGTYVGPDSALPAQFSCPR